ncbi:recombinase family protein [Bacillus pretiosus]|nr:recombinase family protein [Bacillus cereus]NEL01914.1 recombinase family protein [Bacillus mobilis]HDX9550029.1 recombinase family protein [Bacillus thuringiensis]MBL3740208.1 recombinase family protein [Bacillus cereus]MBL3862833.1 recombinase family protein [Bacillus cereus]
MKKTISYYRSSTSLQENSILMQRSRVVHYSMQKKIPIDEEYIDEYISSRKITLLERPAMAKLIKDIEMGIVDRILVYKRDRLARDLSEHLKLYELFKKYNIKVCFASGNEIPMMYSPMGEYIESILGAIAEHEGTQIAERIMETRIANFMSGKSAGNLPFGYKIEVKDDEKVIEKVDEELAIVREIYDCILDDKFKTLQELYKDLNERGKLKRNTKWHQQLIIDTVSNPLYMGTRRMVFNDQRNLKYLLNLSIVSESEWNEVNDKVLGMSIKRTRTEERAYFPLTELLKCHACRKELSTNTRMRNGKKYKVYECKEHNVFLIVDQIEKDVLKHAKEFFTKMLQDDFEKLYRRGQYKNIERLKKWIANQEKIVKTCEYKFSKKIDIWLKKEKSHHQEEMNTLYDELKEERERLLKLQKRLYEVRNIKEQAERWCKELQYENSILILKEEQRKEFYHDIIETIFVSDYEYHIVFKHPFMMVQEVYCEPEEVSTN